MSNNTLSKSSSNDKEGLQTVAIHYNTMADVLAKGRVKGNEKKYDFHYNAALLHREQILDLQKNETTAVVYKKLEPILKPIYKEADRQARIARIKKALHLS